MDSWEGFSSLQFISCDLLQELQELQAEKDSGGGAAPLATPWAFQGVASPPSESKKKAPVTFRLADIIYMYIYDV